MSAQGYKSSPLSDGLESRIRERLVSERQEGRTNARMGREHMAAISDGRVSALEWVLREAESIKVETARTSPPRWESTCLTCGHVHEGDGECRVSMGKGGYCDCKAEVTA